MPVVTQQKEPIGKTLVVPLDLAHDQVPNWLKIHLNSVKAGKGLSWDEIARRISTVGRTVSGGSLSSKHSRGTLTAVDLVQILLALEAP